MSRSLETLRGQSTPKAKANLRLLVVESSTRLAVTCTSLFTMNGSMFSLPHDLYRPTYLSKRVHRRSEAITLAFGASIRISREPDGAPYTLLELLFGPRLMATALLRCRKR